MAVTRLFALERERERERDFISQLPTAILPVLQSSFSRMSMAQPL